MFKLLLIHLIVGGSGLKVSSEAKLQCPSATSDQDNVLFWGMILDGKDHGLGKNAYNWHGFKQAYKALEFVMDHHAEPLSYKMLMQARKIVAKGQGTEFDWAGTKDSAYEGPVFKYITCLGCAHLKELATDVPSKYLIIKKGKNPNFVRSGNASCADYKSFTLKPKAPGNTIKELKGLIETYNADMDKLTSKEEKLVRLTSFLKDFAFLHPWGNGNGRFKTLMLNHEVRRLGLGCGTMMFNNNKDIYYITKKVYLEKVKEGIAMYDDAMATGKSPWLDANVVAKHKERFDPDITMPGLTSCRHMDQKKGSYWLDMDGHEEAEEDQKPLEDKDFE